VEWWDAYFLPSSRKTFSPYVEKDAEGNLVKKEVKEIKFEDFVVEDFAKEKITPYIQHPVPLKNDYIEKMNKVNLPMFLTKKERKRLRKLRRQEKEKDKQEKLKLGLIEPDKPKLKFNNFMRIMSEEAIQDPSKVEGEVRKAYEERYAKMISENEAKKLTKEQRHEKIRRKFERDIKKECRACLFKIDNFPNKRIKFKIDKNAQQLYLTGICIYAHKSQAGNLPNLLLVEGGPLAIKKYKNLILRRLKWESTNKVVYLNNILGKPIPLRK
jgi:U4/U6 small nuclear ribonucleoprotein PRP3